MPKCYQLVGVPGSGKSTWAKNQDWAADCVYVSTDQHVEGYAQDQGKTYSEVFEEYMPTAVKQMMFNVNMAAALGSDIVWDQTSTTIASRARKFNALPDYEHIAIVFRTPDRDELDARLSGRPGKHIPKNVVDSMIANWDEPTLEEGFKEIWFAG